jgi:prefoldin subunit 5
MKLNDCDYLAHQMRELSAEHLATKGPIEKWDAQLKELGELAAEFRQLYAGLKKKFWPKGY